MIPLERPEAGGHSGDMSLNGVYLVAEEAQQRFHDEVRPLRTEFEPDGIEVVPTDPRPPFNFVRDRSGPVNPPRTLRASPSARSQPVSLADVIDRLLAGGVVVHGHVTLSVADIDLIDVDVVLPVAATATLAGR